VTAVILALVVGVIIVGYGLHVAKNPWRRCLRCGGGGMLDARFITQGRRVCGCCAKSQRGGHHPRIAVWVTQPSKAKQMAGR